MNQEIKIIAPSKECISEHWYTLKLLPQKMNFRTLVRIKTASSKNAIENVGP